MSSHTERTKNSPIVYAYRELKARPLIGVTLALAIGILTRNEWMAVGALVPILALTQKTYLIGIALFGYLIAPEKPQLLTTDTEFADYVKVVIPPRPNRFGEQCIVQAHQERYALVVPAKLEMAQGDQLFVSGVVRPFSQNSADQWKGYAARGTLEAGIIRIVSRGPTLGYLGGKIRRDFVEFVRQNFSVRGGAVADALCFNHDSRLSRELRNDLSRSGLIHIISTSGLHILLVGLALQSVFRLLPVPRWFQFALLLCLLSLYAAAAGMRPPMVRGVVMFGSLGLATFLGRTPDGISSVFLGAIVVLLSSPSSVFDVGFQLSLWVTLVLVMFLSLDQASAGPKTVAQTAITTLGSSFWATLAAVPILAYTFKGFSVIGVLSNALVACAVPVVTIGSLIAWLVHPVLPALSELLIQVLLDPLANSIAIVAHECSKLPFAYVETQQGPGWLVGFAIVLLLSFWRPRRLAPRFAAS